MNPQIQKPVTVLFLGSLTHSDDTNFLDRTKPHEDEIDFQCAVKVSLIRIPRPGKDIYSRHISITQSQPIKNFQIYYRNLQKTNGRYSLLTANNELLASSTDDILITPKQPIFTDLLLIKGNFTKITLSVYGNILKDELTLSQKCPNYLTNAPIEPILQGAIQIKKDIFQQKLKEIRSSESSLEDQNSNAKWPEIINEEGINEQQIDGICQLSEKLLALFTQGRLIQEEFVVEFRTGLEEVSANLAKIFKNKQLGLYYPSIEVSNIQNDLSLCVTELALNSLNLSLSEKIRSLQILKFMLQLEKHAEFFIEKGGVQKLIKIYVEFFKLNTVVLSTYKNLILEVLVSLSHWKKAAFQITQKIPEPYYLEIFEEVSQIVEKNSEQRERSRQKKTKRSRSDSESQQSDDENKKKKKDKQKKRNRSREKKKGKESKSKQEILKKAEQQKSEPKQLGLREEIGQMSFYQILLMQLSRQKSIKQLIMIKVVLEQILQTMTKSKVASQRVSLSTSLLKDIKYIFNPAGEVLNNKSLKQLASFYHPFLNSVQSIGVEGCDFISQREKLHNMSKYGINSKVVRLLNRLSLQLAQSQSTEENGNNEGRPPYSQQFIVMLSEVVRSNDKMTMYGFGRMLNSFKAGGGNDIVYLKKIEAGMTMISEFIYKALIQDSGLYTVLNLDQIYSALINITNNLSKDPSAFTKQLKKKIRQLTNYAMAYDLFNSSQGNFKTISDHFLRLFKFQFYEINKINDYKKKEFQLNNQSKLSLNNLSEVANLGSFYQLFPEQPLLEIDVYLKIFTIILQYNKNVWCLFYENKLVSGFVVLFNKLSDILKFMLQSSVERQSLLLTIKKPFLMIENYLSVLNRVTKILVKKQQYESAFNDLIQEDNFEHVEIYEKSLQIYISLFNAVYNKSSLLSSTANSTAREILSSIMELYDKLLESYELTSHSTRENKLKEFFSIIYIKHFVSLKSRGACLSLMSFVIEAIENVTLKLFTTFFIEQSAKIEQNIGKSIQGYVPLNNERSMLQNLILANIFRKDPIIQNNLANLIKNLLSKHVQKFSILEKVTSIIQNVFDNIQGDLKIVGSSFQNNLQVIKLEKMNLLSEILKKLGCVLTLKFEEKLLKLLRFVDSIKFSSQEANQYQLQAFKLGMRIKSNLVLFLKKSFCEKPQHPQALSFIQLLAKSLDISQRLTKSIQQRQVNCLSKTESEFEIFSLELVDSCMDVICGMSINPYSQSVLLYEVFLEKPYKPAPQISLINIFAKLTSREFIDFLNSQNKEMQLQYKGSQQASTNPQQFKLLIKNILIRTIYLLCLLTTIDSVEFYSTESRRAAITCLITEDKDFPFSKIEPFKFILPQQLLQTLKDYFSYPIVQKSLTLKSEDKKQSLKNKGYLYSKAIFTIIMEGDLAAKARYQYIAGPWKGGDVSTNFLYSPTRERQYNKLLDKSLIHNKTEKQTVTYYEFSQPLTISNQQKAILQPIELNIKKRTKNIQKKQSVDTQIKLMNIPLVIEYQAPLQKGELPGMIKRVSPSPSKKGQGYTKSASQSSYDGRVRVSPSPPSHKIPGQNIIGFNGVGQITGQQYGGQQMAQGQAVMQENLPSTNVSSSMTGMIPVQTGQQIPMQTGMQGQRWMSPSKQQYPEQGGNIQQKPMQQPQYPNPYYGGSHPVKLPQTGGQISQPTGTLPYLQMQKVGSHEANGGQMRSGSNSAPRSNVPYGNYPQQQYYPANNPQYQGGGKMYDNRPQSQYQKQYPNQGYQRMNYQQQQQQGGNYYQQQDQRQSYSNYNQGGRQGSYQQMPNRSYQQQQYGGYDYPQQQRSQHQNYSLQQQQSYYPHQQQQRLFNEAILLVTQLRGTLPDHLKNDKKSRLNLILHNNIRIQNRVKEYINSLK